MLTETQAESILAALGWSREDWNGYPAGPLADEALACADWSDEQIGQVAALQWWAPDFSGAVQRITGSRP